MCHRADGHAAYLASLSWPVCKFAGSALVPRGKTTSPTLYARYGQIPGLRAADKQFILREAASPRYQPLGDSTKLEGDCTNP